MINWEGVTCVVKKRTISPMDTGLFTTNGNIFVKVCIRK